MKKKCITFGLILLLNSSLTFGDSLREISLFAMDICDSIRTEGSISRKEITAKLEGQTKGIAKLIGASVAADGTIKIDNTEYKGLPYKSLPSQMQDSRACKKDIAKMLLDERKTAKKKFKKESRQRKYELSERNGHCNPDRRINIRVNADNGWSIDVTSIAPSINTSKRSNFVGISNKSVAGFNIVGDVRNNGKCVFGVGDARGHIWGSVGYKEFRKVEVGS